MMEGRREGWKNERVQTLRGFFEFARGAASLTLSASCMNEGPQHRVHTSLAACSVEAPRSRSPLPMRWGARPWWWTRLDMSPELHRASPRWG